MSDRVVVVGLGYVGLPLALAAAKAGYDVHGVDSSADLVRSLGAGRSHIVDVTDDQVGGFVERGGRFGTDASVVGEASVVVLCVPTPLREGSPDLSAIQSAAADVAPHLKAGTLVILESTTYPGTTEEELVPLLAEGSGLRVPDELLVAYSPERIDPGNATWKLENTPKIVGGVDRASTDAAVRFYDKFVSRVVSASSPKAAEMSKLLENTYRHVNIALVNELALVADDLGVDIFEVIELAATKPFGFEAFYPGPGVGGHCIPIDPHYLSYRLRSLGRGFRFVELAREINDSMPAFVCLRVMETLNDGAQSVAGSRIVLAGVSYKANVGDVREAPSIPIVRRLRSMGAGLVYVDPYVDSFAVDGIAVDRADDLLQAASECELMVVITPHDVLPIETASRTAPLTLDTRGVLAPSAAVRRL